MKDMMEEFGGVIFFVVLTGIIIASFSGILAMFT